MLINNELIKINPHDKTNENKNNENLNNDSKENKNINKSNSSL